MEFESLRSHYDAELMKYLDAIIAGKADRDAAHAYGLLAGIFGIAIQTRLCDNALDHTATARLHYQRWLSHVERMEDLVNRQGQTMAGIEQVLVRIANALEQTTKGGGLST